MLLPIIAVLSVFGTSGFVLYLFLTNRTRERMALIENGADAKIFNQHIHPRQNLKWGMFLVAIGLAIFVAYFLTENFRMEEEAAYSSLVFIFGGASLLLYYNMTKKFAEDAI